MRVIPIIDEGVAEQREREILSLCSRGFRVAELRTGSKAGVGTGWKKRASDDPSVIRQWVRKHPSANVAVLTGRENGLIVIDVDGDTGKKSLDELLATYGPLPQTLTALTSRGKHLYFKAPAIAIKSSTLLPGLEVKAERGHVTAPPSVHESGHVYHWEDESLSPAELPIAWVGKLTEEIIPTATEGARNSNLFKYAGQLLRGELPPDEVRKLAHDRNRQHCKPPLSDSEVEQIVVSAVSSFNPDYTKDVEHTIETKRINLRWFPVYAEDVLENMNSMELEDYAIGQRFRLLCYAWRNDGKLPDNPDMLARIAFAGDIELFKKNLRRILYDFRVVTEGRGRGARTYWVHEEMRERALATKTEYRRLQKEKAKLAKERDRAFAAAQSAKIGRAA